MVVVDGTPDAVTTLKYCLAHNSGGWAVQLPAPAGIRRHSFRLGYSHRSASRARIIAGLSGFLILSQSRDGPDR
jgi:hypothetical protein